MFSRRTWRGPGAGAFHTAVCTVWPCQATSFGSPTLTDISRPTGRSALTVGAGAEVTVARCMVGLLHERASRLMSRRQPYGSRRDAIAVERTEVVTAVPIRSTGRLLPAASGVSSGHDRRVPAFRRRAETAEGPSGWRSRSHGQ